MAKTTELDGNCVYLESYRALKTHVRRLYESYRVTARVQILLAP